MRWRWYHSLGLAMVLLSPSGGPGVGAPPGFKPKPIIDTQVFIFTMHATHYRAMGLDKRLAAGATTLARGKLRGLHVEVMNHPASVQVQLPRLRGGPAARCSLGTGKESRSKSSPTSTRRARTFT